MPRAKRHRREPTDDWQQLQPLTQFPEQLTYELIRPVVLFGQTPLERARATGTPQRTLLRVAPYAARRPRPSSRARQVELFQAPA